MCLLLSVQDVVRYYISLLINLYDLVHVSVLRICCIDLTGHNVLLIKLLPSIFNYIFCGGDMVPYS